LTENELKARRSDVDELPNIIVPGYARSGTTWLYNMFKMHPDVFVPNRKEMNYFGKNDHRGISWYKDYYRNNDGKDACDISPGYVHRDGVAEDIKRTIPDAKIILMLRNPVHRATSALFRTRSDEGVVGDINELIRRQLSADPTYFNNSLYSETVKKYISLFGQDNVHFAIYEDLTDEPYYYTRSILDFLNIESEYFLSEKKKALQEKVNPTRRPTIPKFHDKLQTLNQRLRFLGNEHIDKTVNLFKPLYFMMFMSQKEKNIVDEKHFRKLKEIYWEDVEELGTILNRDLVQLWLSR